MQERTERKAVLTGMTFAIVVGFAFLANKAALTGGGLYDVLTYRFLFALLVLPVVLKISKLSLRIAKKDIPPLRYVTDKIDRFVSVLSFVYRQDGFELSCR